MPPCRIYPYSMGWTTNRISCFSFPLTFLEGWFHIYISDVHDPLTFLDFFRGMVLRTSDVHDPLAFLDFFRSMVLRTSDVHDPLTFLHFFRGLVSQCSARTTYPFQVEPWIFTGVRTIGFFRQEPCTTMDKRKEWTSILSR